MREVWQGVLRLMVPTNPEEFWALVSAVIGGIVLYVAIRGLRSLALTREGMLTQANREARACAIARCEEFAEEIIPNHTPIANSFAANQVPVFVREASAVKFDPDGSEHLERAIEWWSALPPETRHDCMKLLNRMEAWAMYFTNQLADPKVAFGPCGPFFCSLVIQLYAPLIILRQQDTSGNYPNTVKLFKAWMGEMEDQKRGLMEGELLQQLRALQARGSQATRLPDPLGTRLES